MLWLKYIEDKKQRRLFKKEIGDYLREKTARQVFTQLRYHCRKKQLEKSASNRIVKMINTRLQRGVLFKMMSKCNKKLLLKSKQARLSNQRNHLMMNHCFGFWFNQYNNLRTKEIKITQKHNSLVKRSVMTAWRAQVKQMTYEQKKINIIQGKVNRTMKLKVIRELQQYTINQRDKKQLNVVSRYFFINKVLKKTINALRLNAKESKFTGFYGQKNDQIVLRECFSALKSHCKTQKRVKRFQILS